jgi:putative SOS response-associated peptidase YedK
MTRNREAILRLFRVSHNRAAAYETRDAIFPGYQAPVVRKAADGERELVALNWGFVLLQKDKAPKRVTNIRDDKAQSKFWRRWWGRPRLGRGTSHSQSRASSGELALSHCWNLSMCRKTNTGAR